MKKSNLQERMQSEGMGRVEFVEGYDAPTYTEIYEDEEKSEEIDLEKSKDQIKGGLADKLSIEQIADKHGVSVKSIKKQIKKGTKVEMEHTDDPTKAAEIARDHVYEIKDYYTRLAKMEDEAKKENKEDE